MKMENKLRKAKVKTSGLEIQVYKTIRGTWRNYKDCTTEYSEEQLTFLD